MLWAFQGAPANLFFALKPPDTLCPVIEGLGARLQRAHRLRGSRIARERLHNTLAPVLDRRGRLADTITRAQKVGARIKAQPFSVRFEWSGSFDVGGGRYPLVLRGGLAPLIDFQRELRAQMLRAGFIVRSSYTPHITLLWADRRVEEYPIAPIEWTVTDFVLVASLVGHACHIPIECWRLGPGIP